MRDTPPASHTSNLPKTANAAEPTLMQRVLDLFQSAVAPASEAAQSELPQFPGVTFQARGVNFDQTANDNDTAIRASLIYFKHRWPGQVATVVGSPAFRRKVRRIAEEVSLPLAHDPGQELV